MLWRWMAGALEHHHPGTKLGKKPKGFDTWALARLEDATGPPPGDFGVLRAWERFLIDPDFAERAWPVPVFIHENVWSTRTAPWPESKKRRRL